MDVVLCISRANCALHREAALGLVADRHRAIDTVGNITPIRIGGAWIVSRDRRRSAHSAVKVDPCAERCGCDMRHGKAGADGATDILGGRGGKRERLSIVPLAAIEHDVLRQRLKGRSADSLFYLHQCELEVIPDCVEGIRLVRRAEHVGSIPSISGPLKVWSTRKRPGEIDADAVRVSQVPLVSPGMLNDLNSQLSAALTV